MQFLWRFAKPSLSIHERSCVKKRHDQQKFDKNKCPRCPFKFQEDILKYQIHHLTTHLSLQAPFQVHCPLCRKGFLLEGQGMQAGIEKLQKSLVNHLIRVHDISGLEPAQVHTCLKCPTSVNFRNLLLFRQHVQEFHIKRHTCVEPECAGLTFFSFTTHLNKCHKDNEKYFPVTCGQDKCHQRFRTPKDLSCHMNKAHSAHEAPSKVDKSFTCDHCEQSFSRKYRLEVELHKFCHEDGYEEGTLFLFSCPYKCSTFDCFFKLQSHLHSKHDFKVDNSYYDSSCVVQIKPEVYGRKSVEFQCNVEPCTRQFWNALELENHMKHHGSFPCQLCRIVMNDAESLAWHETKHSNCSDNKNKNSISCSRCPASFPYSGRTQSVYERHFLEKHLGVAYATSICGICHSPIPNRRAEHFVSCHHIAGMDPADVQKCKECPAYFKDAHQLVRHNREIHNIRGICHICGKQFLSKYYTNHVPNHLKQVHKLQPQVACKNFQCSKKFYSKLDMDLHYCKLHQRKMECVECPTCHKVISKCGRIAHKCAHLRNIPKTEGNHVCESCGKGFIKPTNLQQHQLIHLGSEKWEFCCETCGKKCMTKSKLMEHMRTNTKEKNFQCPHCGVKYAHRHNLRIHVNSKHGDVAQDVPRHLNKTNLTSRKGIPVGKRSISSGVGRKRIRNGNESTTKGPRGRKKRKVDRPASSDYESDTSENT